MTHFFTQKNNSSTRGLALLVKESDFSFLSRFLSKSLFLSVSLKNKKALFPKKTSLSYTTGFTLVELMVATSIFMIIMVMALGSLVISSDSAKKGQALRATMDNVNFAMDTMTRSIRMGTEYTCVGLSGVVGLIPEDCPLGGTAPGGTAFAFKPAPPQTATRIIYRLVERPTLVLGDVPTRTIQRCDFTGEASCIDIVAPEVDVEELRFFVKGSGTPDTGDFVQPSVYIMMKGTVSIKGVPTTFALQTMASQRTAE